MTSRALHLLGWVAWSLAWELEFDRRKREALLITDTTPQSERSSR